MITFEIKTVFVIKKMYDESTTAGNFDRNSLNRFI